MKDRELKDREVKIKRDIEEIFFKPIIVHIDDMDKFEQKETNQTRPIKNTWYDWLITYIPEPTRKSLEVISLFKANTPKQAVYWRGKETKQTKTTKPN